MRMKLLIGISCVIAGTLLLSACSSSHHAKNKGAMGSVGGADGALTSHGLGGDGFADGEGISDLQDTRHMSTAQLLQIRVFHFLYDNSEVSANDRAPVVAHAHYLANHPESHILLAGNTDSRGSREYNIALGLRRAQSIQSLMLLNGARRNQVTVTSYGEEKPVAFGDDEAAYAQNRRVELIYEN